MPMDLSIHPPCEWYLNEDKGFYARKIQYGNQRPVVQDLFNRWIIIFGSPPGEDLQLMLTYTQRGEVFFTGNYESLYRRALHPEAGYFTRLELRLVPGDPVTKAEGVICVGERSRYNREDVILCPVRA